MPSRKLNASEMADFYRRIHRESFQRAPDDPLDAVIHPEGNSWLNRYADFAHRRGARHLLNWLETAWGTFECRKILDLGCGRGRWTKQFLLRGADVTGVDISAEAIDRLREEHPQANFQCQDLAELELEPGSFDAVNSVTVIQHLPSLGQDRLLRRLYELLKPGGYFVILEHASDFSSAHVFAHSPQEWRAMAEAAGFQFLRGWGSNFDFLLRLASSLQPSRAPQGSTPPPQVPSRHPLRQVAQSSIALASLPVEWASTALPLPIGWATHCAMCFQRKG